MNHTIYMIWQYYAERGGLINLCIALAFFSILYIGLCRLFYYISLRRMLPTADQLRKFRFAGGESQPWLKECFSDWNSLDEESKKSPKTFVNRYREILLHEIPRLEDGLSTMAILISVTPLLGLLGTVSGMMETFAVITKYGIGNPGLLSEGISISLVTTQTGLLAAFPALLFHNWLSGRKERLLNDLLQLGEAALREEICDL